MTNGKFLELRGNDFKKKTGIGIGVCAASVVGLVMLQMCERSKPAPECLYPCEPPRVCTEPAPITLVAPPPVEKKPEKAEKAKPREKTPKLNTTPAGGHTASVTVATPAGNLEDCKREVSNSQLKDTIMDTLGSDLLDDVRKSVDENIKKPYLVVSYQIVDGTAKAVSIGVKATSDGPVTSKLPGSIISKLNGKLKAADSVYDGSCKGVITFPLSSG